MSNPSSPASPSSDSDTESSVPECRVCGKSGGAPLCRFYPASLYGEAFVGNDETDCLHFACGSSSTANKDWALLSVAQVKKTYGQGKAAKLALTKTRTAAGPRKFGNVTEVVLVQEFVANLVAAGGSATPKASKKKKTPAKGKGSFMKKKMTLGQMRRFL